MKLVLALSIALAPFSVPTSLGEPPAQPLVMIATEPRTPTLEEIVFTGTATWYDADRRNLSTWYTREGVTLYGAIGARIRAVKQHYWRTSWEVRITSLLTGKSVIVHVVDVCTCYGVRSNPNDDPLIDLSPEVWGALGVRLGRGVMPITLQVLP